MDLARSNAIYTELGTMIVELDSDPVTRGAAYLQELISRTRGYLNRTSVLLQEVYQEQQSLDSTLNAKKTIFQIQSDEMLANDARVKGLPNIDDRRAMINLIMREERKEILSLEQAIRDLGYTEKAIKHRHKELDNTISAIRMQKSLIDSERHSGSFYGDESDKSRGDVYRKGTSQPKEELFDDEISNMFDECLKSKTESVSSDLAVSEPEELLETPAIEAKALISSEKDEFSTFLGEGDDLSSFLETIDV